MSVASATGGKVTSNRSSAAKGATVTLTKKSDTEYTLTMPAAKVTVTPVFAKTSAPAKDIFTDVPASAYYAPAVAKGVTDGTTATTFSPDNTCTRAQIVTFLYRAQ